MSPLSILRPMAPADVDPAADAILASGWHDRRPWFRFAATHDGCRPVVAELDGEIVGTGVGTVNGTTGWVGTIWVAPDRRRLGLGQALTGRVVELLADAGCRSMLLVATPEGRPLYERLGFRIQTTYVTFEAPGTLGVSASLAALPGATLLPGRPAQPSDLPAIVTLDAAATGETREHLLRRFVTPETARVVTDPGGRLLGYVARAPWGGGATIASDPGAAVELLEARRATHDPGTNVRAGVPAEHRAGVERLEAAGWHRGYEATRMLLGEPPPWRPELIWGQFNMAVG